MKFTRKAIAIWNGTGKDGSGTVTTQSTTLNEAQYSYKTRFEEGVGTNPEELIAAAHSGCFAMQLSFLLSEKGYKPSSLEVEARVTFEDGSVIQVALKLEGEVAEISEREFQGTAEKAKEICPISRLLNAEIGLTATLVK